MALATTASGCLRSAPEATATEGFLASPDGTRLYYEVAGSGSDTVIIVHGGPGAGANSIKPDLLPLSRNHVLIFYDQRGGGRSELPADTSRLTAQAFIEDLDAVREHFQLRTASFIAHSFGAVVVGQYATTHPDRVARIALLSATGPSQALSARFYQRGPRGLDSATAVSQFNALRSLMEGAAAEPTTACRTFEDLGKLGARNRGEFAGWRGSSCDMPIDALRYYWRYTARLGPAAFGEWDFTNTLTHVAAPLLVISGGSDTLAQAMDRAWAHAMPNSRILFLSTTSRATYAELPQVTFRALDRFLAGNWPQEAREPH